MKRATILFTVLWLTLGAAAAGNPKADPRAVVEAGNARFTVLTPQLIRMEWSEDGRFEDRATLTFVNRETPVPDFKVRDTKSRLTITTPALTLTYTKGGKFSDKNLKAVFRLNGREVVWTPGTEDPQNLMGTTRTLDGCDGRKLGREPMEQGLLSRAGWSVVDDSGRHVLTPDGSAWKEWVEARPRATARTSTSSPTGTTTSRRSPISSSSQAARRCLRSTPSATGGAATGSIRTTSSSTWCRNSSRSTFRSTC
ncbi:MAG: hypothetical protein ACLU9X_10075 [Alistipes shahii]